MFCDCSGNDVDKDGDKYDPISFEKLIDGKTVINSKSSAKVCFNDYGEDAGLRKILKDRMVDPITRVRSTENDIVACSNPFRTPNNLKRFTTFSRENFTSVVGLIDAETDTHVYVIVVLPEEDADRVLRFSKAERLRISEAWPWPNPRVESGDIIEFQTNNYPSEAGAHVGEVVGFARSQKYIEVKNLSGPYTGSVIELWNSPSPTGKIDFWSKGLNTERVYARLLEKSGRIGNVQGLISSYVRQRRSGGRRRSHRKKTQGSKRRKKSKR